MRNPCYHSFVREGLRVKFGELDNWVQVVIGLGTIGGMIFIMSQFISIAITAPKANAENISQAETKIEAIEDRYNKHVESAYKDFLTRQEPTQQAPTQQAPNYRRMPRRQTVTTLPRRQRKHR